MGKIANKKSRFKPAKNVRRLKSSRKASATGIDKLIDDLAEIGRRVPLEEWTKLPPDFNENLGHYLYGSPKKRPTR